MKLDSLSMKKTKLNVIWFRSEHFITILCALRILFFLIMQLLNRLKNFYLNHYHYFCYYQNLVRKHGIHFGQKNYNQPIIRIKRPFFFVKLSAALSLYYFVVFGGYVKYPCLHEQCPIWILVDIIPDAHKDYFCATIAIWGWMHLLMMIFGLSSKLHRFRFLATLNLDDPNTIKYLNLDEEMLQKINRFYRLVFSWYSKVPVLTADTGCFLATSKETIEKALWERSFILCVANVIICKIWCYHASNSMIYIFFSSSLRFRFDLRFLRTLL